MNPVRSRDIRESNEKLILKLIRNGSGVSQSEVVSKTGLRAPTVLRFFNHLEEQGFIRPGEREPDKEKRGRKPVYYEPVPEAAYAMGLEFWAYSGAASIIDFAGRVIYNRTWSLNPQDEADVLNLLQKMYAESLAAAGIDEEKILGLCVAAPGQIDIETGELVQYSRMGVADINLKVALEEALGLPVIVQNNSSAVAWDEFQRGAGKDVNSLFMVMVRAGVGGSFLDDGEIFVTKTHTTLEIGHISVEYEGRLCDCGSRGCLETYLSEGALIDDLSAVEPVKTIGDVDKLLEINSPRVVGIMEHKIGLLTQAVRNLISLFGPEMFLLVTRSPVLGRYLADGVENKLKDQASRRWQGQTIIQSAVYDPEKAGRGAADLVYKHFFA